MNLIGLAQLEPGQGVNIVRVYNGALLIIPPKPAILAEYPHEALVVLADWLGMRKQGKTVKEGEPPLRYPWAAQKFQVGPGAALLVARLSRGRASDEPAFMATHHFGTPNTVWQGALWNPMQVLEHVNGWMSSIPMMRTDRLDAMRLVPQLDWESDEVFAIRVQLTDTLGPEEPVPSRDAPWTIMSATPALQCGIGDGPIATYFEESLIDEPVGFFAARLHKNTLEIGQRLPNPDLNETDGS